MYEEQLVVTFWGCAFHASGLWIASRLAFVEKGLKKGNYCIRGLHRMEDTMVEGENQKSLETNFVVCVKRITDSWVS
jgi:hypothetical protein